MNLSEIREIVRLISYKPGWTISANYGGVGGVYIQLSVDASSEDTLDSQGSGRRIPWKSGKRYLSPHMCRQEIVGVVFSLIMAAEEHEAREWFRYRGAAIYNAHLDPDVLAEVAKRKASFCVREDAMGMAESEG